jgi:hypothetical protein
MTDVRKGNGSSAHETWLQCNKYADSFQAASAKSLAGHCDGAHLGMRGSVLIAFPRVFPFGNHFTVFYNNRANRNIPMLKTFFGIFNGKFHKIFFLPPGHSHKNL